MYQNICVQIACGRKLLLTVKGACLEGKIILVSSREAAGPAHIHTLGNKGSLPTIVRICQASLSCTNCNEHRPEAGQVVAPCSSWIAGDRMGRENGDDPITQHVLIGSKETEPYPVPKLHV